MTARIPSSAPQPDVMTGVQHLYKAAYSGGVSPEVLELIHLRASQINGCSACVDSGLTSAAKSGVSQDKLLNLAAWYENPIFNEDERAALALTEAATRLADRPGSLSDEIWAAAAARFDPGQLNAIVLMVAITNFFNRINTSLRVPAGTTWE